MKHCPKKRWYKSSAFLFEFRMTSLLALIIPGATGGAVREGADFLAGYGDDLLRAGEAGSYLRNVLVVGESHTFEYSIGLARRNPRFRVVASTLSTALSGLDNLPSNLTILTGIDATQLGRHFPAERFDDIIFNAPRSLRGWQGATGDLVDNVLTSASDILSPNGSMRFSSSHGMPAGNRLWGHASGGTTRFPIPTGYGIPTQIAYLADEVFGIRYTPLRNDGAALSTALEDMWWFIFTPQR